MMRILSLTTPRLWVSVNDTSQNSYQFIFLYISIFGDLLCYTKTEFWYPVSRPWFWNFWLFFFSSFLHSPLTRYLLCPSSDSLLGQITLVSTSRNQNTWWSEKQRLWHNFLFSEMWPHCFICFPSDLFPMLRPIDVSQPFFLWLILIFFYLITSILIKLYYCFWLVFVVWWICAGLHHDQIWWILCKLGRAAVPPVFWHWGPHNRGENTWARKGN